MNNKIVKIDPKYDPVTSHVIKYIEAANIPYNKNTESI
jgi:hypothetical protein